MLYNSHKYKKGRGAQLNTVNRFAKNHVEAVIENVYDDNLEQEDEISIGQATQFFMDHPKTILNKVTAADLPMAYSINPYAGCEHGCSYCYARNVHENWGFSAGTDFEQKIIVKPDAPKLLTALFEKKSWVPTAISLSGNTDCYQPAERKYKITRQMLEVFCKYRNPVGIITKNALVCRDIDLLKELAGNDLVQVYISITTMNESLRSTMEPRTVSAKQRIKTIEKLSQAGIPVGIMAAPIIPGLNDHEIPKILETAAHAGAMYAGYTMVRLNGAVGDIFSDWLEKNYPDKCQKVLNQIKISHGGKLSDSRMGTRMRGEGAYAEQVKQLFKIARAKYFVAHKDISLRTDLFRREGLQLKLF